MTQHMHARTDMHASQMITDNSSMHVFTITRMFMPIRSQPCTNALLYHYSILFLPLLCHLSPHHTHRYISTHTGSTVLQAITRRVTVWHTSGLSSESSTTCLQRTCALACVLVFIFLHIHFLYRFIQRMTIKLIKCTLLL